MLYLARSLSQLHFGSLMAVYADSNRENGREAWPEEPEMRQIQLAEEEFYRYLSQVFFKTPGAVYAVWKENGRYVSALRLEPYRDGLLLEALETAPEQRRKGFCRRADTGGNSASLREKRSSILMWTSETCHSLKVHEKCGFRRVADFCRLRGRFGESENVHPVLGRQNLRMTLVIRRVLLFLTDSPRSGAFLPENSGCFPQRSPEAAGGFPAAPMPCGA